MSFTDTRPEYTAGTWFSFMSRTLQSDRTVFSVEAADALARSYNVGADVALPAVSHRRHAALQRWRGLTPDGDR